jgi:hypothetical protein
VAACSIEERRFSQQGRQQARATANLATVSFLAGAAMLGTGVVLWLLDPAAESGARVAPAVGPRSASVHVHLEF